MRNHNPSELCRRLAPVLLCAGVLIGSVAWGAGPPAGEWETTVTHGPQQFTIAIALERDEDDRLGGHLITRRSRRVLQNVCDEDGQLQFTVRPASDDRRFEVALDGRIEAGYRLVGEVKGRGGERPFTATLKDSEPFVGDWQFTQRFANQEVTSVLSIVRTEDGALSGRWRGEDGTLRGTWTTAPGASRLQDIEYRHGHLHFVRRIRFRDEHIDLAFRGRVEDGRLVGTVTSPAGEVSMTGRRVPTDRQEAGPPGE